MRSAIKAESQFVATQTSNIESEVMRRYAEGAQAVERELCCPTQYDPQYLALLPQEILEKDYGCGDPSIYLSAGDTVIDLGAGAGKLCYIIAQKVGPQGRVIGVDFNDAMLKLARKYLDEMAAKLGYANIEFVKARIQDLALDLEIAQDMLQQQPIHSLERLGEFEAECARLRAQSPLIADHSADAVVSNCVLNLVRAQDKERLFHEIFRVLKRGGRAIISDIIADEDPTAEILADTKLWSGCIAGAFREDRFLAMFEEAGFYGVEILARSAQPWQVIDGIEFRSITVRAYKGKEGPCLEREQAVIYKGPWRSVRDDDGHTFHRGQRMAVCDKTYSIMTNPAGPYAKEILPVPPRVEVPLAEAPPFNCQGPSIRHPKATKGEGYRETKLSDNSACDCAPGCC